MAADEKSVHGADDKESATLGEKSRELVEDVQELGRIAAGNVGQAAARVPSQGRKLLDAGKERVKELESDLERAIAKHPIQSLLIALGAGALIGFLLRRK